MICNIMLILVKFIFEGLQEKSTKIQVQEKHDMIQLLRLLLLLMLLMEKYFSMQMVDK